MDRRRFLLGVSGVAALGAVGKLAPTPIVEGIPGVYEPPFVIRSGLPQGTWRMLNQGVAFNPPDRKWFTLEAGGIGHA